MVDNLMIVSGKLRFWTTSPGQSLNKCMDDLLPCASLPPPSAFQGTAWEWSVSVCTSTRGFFFVTGFNSYYKSSLDYLCMCVLNLLFRSLKSLFVKSGVQIESRLLGLSECSHKGPNLVSKLNLRSWVHYVTVSGRFPNVLLISSTELVET